MPILDGNVKSCYYNKNEKCSLERIKVEGSKAEDKRETTCGSFRLKNSGTCVNSADVDNMPNNCLDIDCDAVRCYFNNNCKCTAEHIGIAGKNACTPAETECASFDLQ